AKVLRDPDASHSDRIEAAKLLTQMRWPKPSPLADPTPRAEGVLPEPRDRLAPPPERSDQPVADTVPQSVPPRSRAHEMFKNRRRHTTSPKNKNHANAIEQLSRGSWKRCNTN